MSMLDSFCTSHVLSLRDDASKLLVSEAIFRKLKYNVSESVKRDASIGIFHSETLGIMPSVVQALDNTSLYRLLKCHYGVTEADIGNFISNISVSTARDLILSSYRIYSISFPYKDYLNFIGYKLSDIASDIGNFISNISVSTARDLILSSYRIYSISFPYKDYLNFIGYKLSDIALNELGIEKKQPLS